MHFDSKHAVCRDIGPTPFSEARKQHMCTIYVRMGWVWCMNCNNVIQSL